MKQTEKDITAEDVKRMREHLGMSQAEFWEPAGVSQSVGSGYETGTRIPRPVRILLVIRYAAGLDLDATTHDGVDQILKLAEIQAGSKVAEKQSAVARKVLEKATEHIQHAQDSLAGINFKGSK